MARGWATRASARCAARLRAHKPARERQQAYASATLRQLPATSLAFQGSWPGHYGAMGQRSLKKI